MYMQSFPFELEYYVTNNGRKPFKEWLDNLKDISARAKIRVRLDRVRWVIQEIVVLLAKEYMS
jgi:hypothetical protein